MLDFYGDLLGIRPGILECSRPLSSALKVDALFSAFVKPRFIPSVFYCSIFSNFLLPFLVVIFATESRALRPFEYDRATACAACFLLNSVACSRRPL
jgi:hypothetical protein